MTKRKNISKYNKTWISWFKKNKTKELYKHILDEKFIGYDVCKECGDVIY